MQYKILRENYNALVSINKKVLKVPEKEKEKFLERAIIMEKQKNQKQLFNEHTID